MSERNIIAGDIRDDSVLEAMRSSLAGGKVKTVFENPNLSDFEAVLEGTRLSLGHAVFFELWKLSPNAIVMYPEELN